MRTVGLPLPRPALYDAWLWARMPPPQWRTGPVDVVHATTIIVPPTGRAPLVVTLHDLAFLHEPAHFTAFVYAAYALDVLITVVALPISMRLCDPRVAATPTRGSRGCCCSPSSSSA